MARVAHRLGGDAAEIGKLLQRLLEREDIASLVTPSHVETRENFTAYEELTGEQYRFVLPGSPLHRAEWERARGWPLPQAALRVASGSVPPGAPDDFFARVARHAKALGAKSVVDTSGPALQAALAEGVSLIKPNLVELSDLVGSSLTSDAEQMAACRKLVSDKRTEMVALTLGDRRRLLVTADRAWRAQPMVIEVVSAVGAGDSFVGGLVAALAAGKPLEDAFRIAIAAASAAVMMPGTGLCQPQDVKRLLPQIRIEEIAHALA